MSYFHFKKLHCHVAEIVRHRATLGDRTHLLFWSRWKPAAGGDHGVSVFLGVCCLLFVVACLFEWRLVLEIGIAPFFDRDSNVGYIRRILNTKILQPFILLPLFSKLLSCSKNLIHMCRNMYKFGPLQNSLLDSHRNGTQLPIQPD